MNKVVSDKMCWRRKSFQPLQEQKWLRVQFRHNLREWTVNDCSIFLSFLSSSFWWKRSTGKRKCIHRMEEWVSPIFSVLVAWAKRPPVISRQTAIFHPREMKIFCTYSPKKIKEKKRNVPTNQVLWVSFQERNIVFGFHKIDLLWIAGRPNFLHCPRGRGFAWFLKKKRKKKKKKKEKV